MVFQIVLVTMLAGSLLTWWQNKVASQGGLKKLYSSLQTRRRDLQHPCNHHLVYEYNHLKKVDFQKAQKFRNRVFYRRGFDLEHPNS